MEWCRRCCRPPGSPSGSTRSIGSKRPERWRRRSQPAKICRFRQVLGVLDSENRGFRGISEACARSTSGSTRWLTAATISTALAAWSGEVALSSRKARFISSLSRSMGSLACRARSCRISRCGCQQRTRATDRPARSTPGGRSLPGRRRRPCSCSWDRALGSPGGAP